MKTVDEKTKNKLERLSKSLGTYSEKNDVETNKSVKKVSISPFKTSEVVILLLLTCVVSLLMGGLVGYKISYSKGENIDGELQNFIKNYNYITNNYYGEIDKSKLIDSAVAGMLTTLDKNSSYVGSDEDNFNIYLDGNYTGVGIEVYSDDNGNITIYRVLENSPAAKAGLQEGDILIKVGDKSLVNKNVDEVSKMIKSQKNKFNITYKRGGQEKTVSIKIADISLSSVSSKVINKDNKKIGYIKVTIFALNTYDQFKEELNKLEKQKIDSLIIDLRDNSGGHLSAADDILSLFLDSTHPIYQIKSKEGQNKYFSKGKKDFGLKVVLLVNGNSASASEVVTSALSEQLGFPIIGEKTYGKGTVQELQTLSSGGKYKLTTKTWLTSKGAIVDKKGINPNVEVKLQEDYYKNSNDENDNQLQKAIEEAIK